MPKLELKDIQRELEQGLFWPVYWIYGAERMKSRELLKRIRKAALGLDEGTPRSFNEEILDGTEVTAVEVVDVAQSLSLGGGLKLVVIRDAHALKELELIEQLIGPRGKKEDLASICVFLSKDLDGRKKISKLLTEKAVVVPCEEVGEVEREAWVQYLAKRRGVQLPTEAVMALRTLDPWTLDIVDQEIEKIAISQIGMDPASAEKVWLEGETLQGGTEAFLNAFFGKSQADALLRISEIADRPEESLPLLGLLTWNVRTLGIFASGEAQAINQIRMPPMQMEKFRRWKGQWSYHELRTLTERLAEIDFSLKQTPRLPLGLWSGLVQEFCH